MKFFVFFVLFFLIFSCNTPPRSGNPDFADISENLPIIATPIVFNSNDTIRLESVDLPNNKILKKLRDTTDFTALGKLFQSKDFITIIGYIPDDFGTPMLITIDKNGNYIESFVLYQSVGYDIGYYRSNYVTIYSDNSISIIDSLLTRAIEEDGSNEIPGDDSLIVTKRNFKLTDSGKIIRIE